MQILAFFPQQRIPEEKFFGIVKTQEQQAIARA
jgi:hypothetical protein